MAPSYKSVPQPRTSPLWIFVMVAASVQTVTAFLHEVKAGGRAYSTLAVWYALMAYVKRDSGEILCSQRTLAKTAGITQGDVRRALIRLVTMGVLIKEDRGKYRIHPSVMWKGELQLRQKNEANTPLLTLLDGGLKDG